MNIEEAIYTFLAATSDITDLVPATSIVWVDIDQEVDYPRIVFRNISKPNIYNSDDQHQRWRFFISHANKTSCREIADELFNQIHRKDDELATGFEVDYINNVVNGDPEFIKESEVWEIVQDYFITYH